MFNVLGSKNNNMNLHELEMLTVPEFVRYEEYITIRDSFDIALAKDQELMNKVK